MRGREGGEPGMERRGSGREKKREEVIHNYVCRDGAWWRGGRRGRRKDQDKREGNSNKDRAQWWGERRGRREERERGQGGGKEREGG
jgi:hypothetical protein